MMMMISSSSPSLTACIAQHLGELVGKLHKMAPCPNLLAFTVISISVVNITIVVNVAVMGRVGAYILNSNNLAEFSLQPQKIGIKSA